MNITINTIKEISKELKVEYKEAGKGKVAIKALKDVTREIIEFIKQAQEEAATKAVNQHQDREEIKAYTELLEETLENLPRPDISLLKKQEKASLAIIREEMSKLGSVFAKRQFSMLE